MQAIKIKAFGGPEMLSFTTVQEPVVEENQVLISVESVGVGSVDVLLRKGKYPGLDNAGFIPGMEIVGIVSNVGQNVSEDWIGKKVYAMTSLGGYAEKVVVDEVSLVALPESLSSENALSLGINALVANFSLQRARLSPGDKVFVRGAGGGIGSLVVQLAIAYQYDVTVSTTTMEKTEKLKKIGVTNFLDISKNHDVHTKCDAIIDPVGGSKIENFIGMLNSNGTYVLNGAAGGFPSESFGMELLKRFQSSLTLACFSLNSVSSEEIRTSLEMLFDWADAGKIIPFVSQVFPFEQAIDAHRLLESQSTFGKIVLQINR